jgi:hypothetical protein
MLGQESSKHVVYIWCTPGPGFVNTSAFLFCFRPPFSLSLYLSRCATPPSPFLFSTIYYPHILYPLAHLTFALLSFLPFFYILNCLHFTHLLGVCSTDLRVDTSTNGLKLVCTGLEAIY